MNSGLWQALTWGKLSKTVCLLALNAGFLSGSAEVVNFDAVKPGSPPPGWTFVSGRSDVPAKWQVTVDRSAPSRPYVLSQTPSRNSRPDYSIAVLDRSTCRDGEVSVNLEVVGGRHDRSAGLVWRYRDPQNFYFAIASVDRDSITIWKRVNDRVSLVAPSSGTHRISEREWNLMRVTFRGPKFAVFLGHRKAMEAHDEEIQSPGRVGLWTKTDALSRFDNFRIDRKN